MTYFFTTFKPNPDKNMYIGVSMLEIYCFMIIPLGRRGVYIYC